MDASTVPQLLRNAAAQHGDRIALRQPSGKNVQTWTWNEYLAAAEEIAAGLQSIGIGKGDHVAICSETTAAFYLVDQGILMNGSVSAALYPSYPPEELIATVGRADAKILFVENAKMLAKVKAAPVSHIILMEGTAEGYLSLADLRTHGRFAADVAAADNAILYLTSGATGDPKMVMTTQGSLARNVNMAPGVVPLGPEDCTVAFLPSAHIAQRIGVELLPIRTGTMVSFAENLGRLPN